MAYDPDFDMEDHDGFCAFCDHFIRPSNRESCQVCSSTICDCCVQMNALIPRNYHPTTVPMEALNNNKFERAALLSYMSSHNLSPNDVYQQILTYIPSERALCGSSFIHQFGQLIVDPDEPTCGSCLSNLFTAYLYNYRLKISSSMDHSLTQRPLCRWGKECRTQQTLPSHAHK
eukprot:CAMPEP_0117420930 /NCGR_PEP_ID=MMETSP0758-20121206/2159_1 /TAXON_ID=63605 /ORGANISM="Percolomonas cosmopolitus, Strain AE-1 (ATCC 50343)" /LENGTH=173 /DNA_ID=CAMNT_0005202821 /DNA_START=373 /DNA_END=891 /DNA_ORIENTATION=+